ncbi:MAG: zinc ribbon domain-containing protein [Thaumarchaeota archaeon]|nr:zinc ribbon domain-containing protein [Nitrososphaerota archaeon]
METLKDKLHWKIERTDVIGHNIRAKTHASMRAFGSVLYINLSYLNGDVSKTLITVRAETGGSLRDYGANRARIDKFFKTLREEAEKILPLPYVPTMDVTKSRFCTSCGAPLGQSAAFCGSCGAKIS